MYYNFLYFFHQMFNQRATIFDIVQKIVNWPLESLFLDADTYGFAYLINIEPPVCT